MNIFEILSVAFVPMCVILISADICFLGIAKSVKKRIEDEGIYY